MRQADKIRQPSDLAQRAARESKRVEAELRHGRQLSGEHQRDQAGEVLGGDGDDTLETGENDGSGDYVVGGIGSDTIDISSTITRSQRPLARHCLSLPTLGQSWKSASNVSSIQDRWSRVESCNPVRRIFIEPAFNKRTIVYR